MIFPKGDLNIISLIQEAIVEFEEAFVFCANKVKSQTFLSGVKDNEIGQGVRCFGFLLGELE